MTLFVTATTGSTLGTMLFVTLSFILLAFLIKKTAWPSITKILDERAEKIANDLDTAEAARNEASALAAQREAELAESRKQAHGIVSDAKSIAEENRQVILADAKDEAQSIRTRAQEEVGHATERARTELKKEVADMSVAIAQKVLQKELDAKAHETFIQSFIEGVGKEHEAK